jgi:uncharacterized alpha-E superfamily protein
MTPEQLDALERLSAELRGRIGDDGWLRINADELMLLLFWLEAAARREAALREALEAVIDRSTPAHSAVCASQDDEAECICETGPAMDRAYALLSEVPQ